ENRRPSLEQYFYQARPAIPRGGHGLRVRAQTALTGANKHRNAQIPTPNSQKHRVFGGRDWVEIPIADRPPRWAFRPMRSNKQTFYVCPCDVSTSQSRRRPCEANVKRSKSIRSSSAPGRRDCRSVITSSNAAYRSSSSTRKHEWETSGGIAGIPFASL